MELKPEDGRWAQLRSLKANAKLFAFLQENNISSMAQLHETVASINRDYYDLRGKIVSAERRIEDLKQRMEMWSQYEKYRPIHEKLATLKPNKREQFAESHRAELALYDAAHRYLGKLKEYGEKFTPKKWQAEIAELTRQKDADYVQMRAMREQVKSVEQLRKTAEQLAKQTQQIKLEEQR